MFPDWTVAVAPATDTSSPRTPRCSATTVAPGTSVAAATLGAGRVAGVSFAAAAATCRRLSLDRAAAPLARLEALPLGGQGAPDVCDERRRLARGAVEDGLGPRLGAGLGVAGRFEPRRRLLLTPLDRDGPLGL